MSILNHRSIQDRIKVAMYLQSEVPEAAVFADQLDNSAAWAYGAHPERLYVLLDGNVVYQGGMGPFFYDLNELNQWLVDFKTREGNNNNNNISNNSGIVLRSKLHIDTIHAQK